MNIDGKNVYLLKLLKEKCYKKGDFTLSSGVKSEHYVNCKPLTLSGDGLSLVSIYMLHHVEKDSVAVAGLTLGADPLVAGVAMKSHNGCLDGLIVRKKPKGYGTQAWIEGPLPPEGSKVTVLEDVVTTGGSSLKAVEKIREAGYIVNRVITIVDRLEGGEELMEKSGIELISLFTLEDFVGEV